MKAWELMKHLEEGGAIKCRVTGEKVFISQLAGWDYDPLRNPETWDIYNGKTFKATILFSIHMTEKERAEKLVAEIWDKIPLQYRDGSNYYVTEVQTKLERDHQYNNAP